MKNNSLSEEFLKIILEHASREYPKECCGLVLGPLHKDQYTRVQPCRNLQDEYHVQDPAVFLRTSQTAYWMDPAELLKLQKETRVSKEEIKIIYHSHIDTGAYFSEEDQRLALSEGLPVYHGVLYLVVSVVKRVSKEACFYQWDSPLEKFALVERILIP